MTKENIPKFTVTTLSQSIRNTLETEFEYVRVKGELGRVSRPASGHVYFDLKDDKSILASVVWRGTKLTKRDLIEEGNEVVLVGRISSFSGHSKYQIIVEVFLPEVIKMVLQQDTILLIMLPLHKQEMQ